MHTVPYSARRFELENVVAFMAPTDTPVARAVRGVQQVLPVRTAQAWCTSFAEINTVAAVAAVAAVSAIAAAAAVLEQNQFMVPKT